MQTSSFERRRSDRPAHDLVDLKAADIFAEQQQYAYCRTDRMFAVLMVLQWIGGIAAALLISPKTWIGQTSQIHLHVWAAVFIGAVITFLPVGLAIVSPGKAHTRYTIAIGQMLMGALLIHLTGGRIETHFHVFGSLAFLAFYRDWKVLIPATLVVAADHLIRGVFYPQSVFGIATADNLRWMEHAGWVIFEDIFLVVACLRGQDEWRKMARKTADLDEGERKYRGVFENASDGIINLNSKTEIIFANPAARNIFGYSIAEISGKTLSDLLAGDIRLEDEESIQRYAGSIHSTVAATAVEVIGLHKDGREIEIEISFGEYGAENENTYTAFIRDVSERKRLEAQVKKSDEYRNLFKHANDAIIVFDPVDQNVLDVNDRACRLFGYEREEFIDRDLRTISAEPEAHAAKVTELLTTGRLESYETAKFNKGGKPINLLVNSSLFEFEGKQAVLSIKRDITERVIAENSLRSSELRFRGLIENMSEGLVELDNDDKIKFVNSAFSDMTEYPHHELIGMDASSLFDVSEEKNIIQQWKRSRRKGSSDVHEIKLRTKSGSTIWSLMGAVPMLDAEGRLVGSMGVHTDITTRKESEDRHQYNALHDALTGLPNRALMMEHLRKSLARAARHPETQFALLFLDFDRFKMINDSLGHMAGDKLLIMIARRLEESMRQDDVVARLGGDEYVIMLNDITDSDDIARVVDRVQGVFLEPFDLDVQDVYMTTSIGIAVSKPHYTKPEDMLRDADIAMYKAKAAGRSCHFIFSEEMHEQANYRLQLETEMRLALERDEFLVHYQPIVDLNSQEIVSFEALIRWNNPIRGMVPPNDFILIAEENGLINQIGELVLSESCAQLRDWQVLKVVGPDVSVSVNLSSRQFLQINLDERIQAVLTETGLRPSSLRLEVTESHLMKNEKTTIDIMNRLREIGVDLSIDDFGTGYSNLSYLHRMPISCLKIDRSFIKDLQANAQNKEIVRTIIMMARNLGFSVVAEGVESENQAAELMLQGCNFGQGYLYSKPLAPESMFKFLREQAKKRYPLRKKAQADQVKTPVNTFDLIA